MSHEQVYLKEQWQMLFNANLTTYGDFDDYHVSQQGVETTLDGI
jgi:hypothetical protein